MFFRYRTLQLRRRAGDVPLIFQSVQDFGVMSALRSLRPGGAVPGDTGTQLSMLRLTWGSITQDLPGAAIATLGVCLPSFILMLLVMKFIDRFNDSRGMQGAFVGIRPVTVGMIAAAADIRERNGAGKGLSHIDGLIYRRTWIFQSDTDSVVCGHYIRLWEF